MPARAHRLSDEAALTPFILVLDDALDADAFERCRQAIEALSHRLVDKESMDGKIRFRRYQDYAAPDPTLLAELSERIFSPLVLELSNRCHDLAWRWLAAGISQAIDVQVTSYSHGSQYLWHTDHLVRGRTHNFVLYMTDPEQYSGGELQISFDEPCYGAIEASSVQCHRTIRPARNRLVVMPSHLLHRVTPVECGTPTPDLWYTRLTVNGHLRVPGLEGSGL